MKTILRNEQGIALVVALMLLLLLTMMGLAAISSTTTEIQITANQRTDAQAFHVAEAGIKEALYRLTLPDLGATSIANGGSSATVDGVTFNAAIVDPLVTVNGTKVPNPAWNYKIYFSAAEPADDNSIIKSRTILASSDWANLNYSGSSDSDPNKPVTVRYLTEADLQKWGLNLYDLNNDGDTLDLVYYNPAKKERQMAVTPGSITGSNGAADSGPPAGATAKQIIRVIESYGHNGNGQKHILFETTGYTYNVNTVGALLTAAPTLDVQGSAFVSGYNHLADTTNTKTDHDKINANLYNNNMCNNYTGSAPGDGLCGKAVDPEANCPNNKPCKGYYSGKADTTGNKPAVVLAQGNNKLAQQNNFDAWGGDDANTVGWLKTDKATAFPTLAALLGVEQTVVDSMLANANTNTKTCPSGVTYIDNANSAVYDPGQGNCKSGSGILVVTGDTHIPSNFEFKGLMYIQGDSHNEGSSWILGAAAIKGKVQVKLEGNSTLLYSKQTVDNVVESALNQTGLSFTPLSWREF